MKKRGKGHHYNNKRNKSIHKRKENKVVNDKNYYIKWIAVQFVLYFVILFLFEKIVERAQWDLVPVPQALLLGFISLILTRVVYSSIHRKQFSFGGIFFWGIVLCSLWSINFCY